MQQIMQHLTSYISYVIRHCHGLSVMVKTRTKEHRQSIGLKQHIKEMYTFHLCDCLLFMFIPWHVERLEYPAGQQLQCSYFHTVNVNGLWFGCGVPCLARFCSYISLLLSFYPWIVLSLNLWLSMLSCYQSDKHPEPCQKRRTPSQISFPSYWQHVCHHNLYYTEQSRNISNWLQ